MGKYLIEFETTLQNMTNTLSKITREAEYVIRNLS